MGLLSPSSAPGSLIFCVPFAVQSFKYFQLWGEMEEIVLGNNQRPENLFFFFNFLINSVKNKSKESTFASARNSSKCCMAVSVHTRVSSVV